MFNFRDSATLLERTRDIATGSSVLREGLVLVGVLEGGVEKVKPATGAASEKVVGFSKLDGETFVEDVRVESVTIPSAAPYTVKLSKGNIFGTGPTSYEVRVKPATGADFTQVDPPAATTQFKVSDATAGELTFHSTDAGKVVTVSYRHNLLATEVIQLMPGQRSINMGSAQLLRQVVVKGGKGEVYTKEFAANVDWTTGTLKTLAGGKITMGGTGTDLSALGWRVIKIPDVNDGFLGLAIDSNL